MPDRYGALPFPLTVPAEGATATDPALDVLLEYLGAFINHYGGDAWRSIYKAQREPNAPVMKTFSHDPEDDKFSEKHLPALFLFRNGGSRSEDRAEDIRVTYSTLTLWWAFPSDRDGFRRTQQRAFINGMAKLVDQAFRKERDPVYVAAGDTEPTAATEGSVVLYQAGIQELHLGPARPKAIRIPKGDEVALYPTVEWQLDIEEHRDIDKTLFDALDGVEADFVRDDDSLFSEAFFSAED